MIAFKNVFFFKTALLNVSVTIHRAYVYYLPRPAKQRWNSRCIQQDKYSCLSYWHLLVKTSAKLCRKINRSMGWIGRVFMNMLMSVSCGVHWRTHEMPDPHISHMCRTWTSQTVMTTRREASFSYLNSVCTVEVWEWINNSSHTLLGMWLFIHAGVKVKPC